jgi:hypothetical protein
LLKNQSSQATVLKLWAFPDLQGPPETQLDTSRSHLETPQKHRKQPSLTGKCLKQEVVPGLFQSSQGTVLELWPSPELQGPPGTQLNTSWSHLKTPQNKENDQT